jgi:hypothetical protein
MNFDIKTEQLERRLCDPLAGEVDLYTARGQAATLK